MSKTLSGKTAIVTGAGRGLGRSMALGLARAGANVMLTAARNRREIDQVAAEVAKSLGTGEVRQLLADVASEEDCRHVVSETVREFGGVHILVNNAGRGMRFVSEKFFDTPTKFWETDPAVWQMIVATNVNGPFLMARAAAPHMMRQRWGRIINISINHETMRRAGFSPYGPSKAALESETIIWAQDLAGTGVTVNALLPGRSYRHWYGAARHPASPPPKAAASGHHDSTAPVARFGSSQRSNRPPLRRKSLGCYVAAGAGRRKIPHDGRLGPANFVRSGGPHTPAAQELFNNYA